MKSIFYFKLIFSLLFVNIASSHQHTIPLIYKVYSAQFIELENDLDIDISYGTFSVRDPIEIISLKSLRSKEKGFIGEMNLMSPYSNSRYLLSKGTGISFFKLKIEDTTYICTIIHKNIGFVNNSIHTTLKVSTLLEKALPRKSIPYNPRSRL